MTKQLFKCVFAACLSFMIYGCATREWKPRDMNSRIGEIVEADLNPSSLVCGLLADCKFDLHYFFGSGFDLSKSKRKNILFLPGGPGEIVTRERQSLYALRFEENVIYFDIRGTGFSFIPLSNTYDQFLRAEFVVEDIETLRKRVLDHNDPEINNPWDAIYAHSWGTIVAHRYASKYPKMVRRLILSAPVSRVNADTESARREKIINNLIDIYRRHRTTECPWVQNHPIVREFQAPGPVFRQMDNFCFLRDKQVELIRGNLSTLLNRIEQDYGSAAFLQTFYKDLSEHDKYFQQTYGVYPAEFFNGLRQLELLGAGEQSPLRFDSTTTLTKINAAFLAGHFLTLPDHVLENGLHPLHPQQKKCNPKTPFLEGLPDAGDILRENFCGRIVEAWDKLEQERSYSTSARARSAFGVYDGLARWIFNMLEKERRLDAQGCFNGRDLQDVARGNILRNRVIMQHQASYLGTSTSEKFCPWDPARYRHDVPTLILSGDADPVIAGGQAEYFYNRGLASGKRVLIEFPGAGHSMVLQVEVPFEEELTPGMDGDRIANLVYYFLRRETAAEFINERAVDRTLNALGARVRSESVSHAW
jgi:pimeloyl-ACP methyl ester carboxylesterase